MLCKTITRPKKATFSVKTILCFYFGENRGLTYFAGSEPPKNRTLGDFHSETMTEMRKGSVKKGWGGIFRFKLTLGLWHPY